MSDPSGREEEQPHCSKDANSTDNNKTEAISVASMRVEWLSTSGSSSESGTPEVTSLANRLLHIAPIDTTEAPTDEGASLSRPVTCDICRASFVPNSDCRCLKCVRDLDEAPPLPRSSSFIRSQNEVTELHQLIGFDIIRDEIETLLELRNVSTDIANRPDDMDMVGSCCEGNDGEINANSLDGLLIGFLQSLPCGINRRDWGHLGMSFTTNVDLFEGIDGIVTMLLDKLEPCGPPALTEEIIEKIPKVKATAEEVDGNAVCPVCLEVLEIGEVVIKLPCTHIFHEDCIVAWLGIQGSCPVCKKNMCDAEELKSEVCDKDTNGMGQDLK